LDQGADVNVDGGEVDNASDCSPLRADIFE
jgi:hypothetical protein